MGTKAAKARAIDLDVFRSAIERAVNTNDGETLNSVAARMADAAYALSILRAKGYVGNSLTMMARQVPPDKL